MPVVLALAAVAGTIIALVSAYTTRQQVALAGKQAQNAHRPVLVPVHGNIHVPFRGGTIHAHSPHQVENPTDRDDLPPYSAVFLPVANIGAGPALDVQGEYKGPRGTGATDFAVGGIGVGTTDVVQFVSKQASLGFTGDDEGVNFELRYEDVMGQVYKTSIHFHIGSNAYRSRQEEMGD
jgi:hypothetical protein